MQKPLLLLTKDKTREKIDNEEIVCVTVAEKYVKIRTIDGRSFIVRTSLQQFEKRLPPDQFSRIHKKHIVCLLHIRFVDNIVTMKTGDRLPIGREYKASFLDKFQIY